MGVSISLVAPLFASPFTFSFPMIPISALTLCIDFIFFGPVNLMDYGNYEYNMSGWWCWEEGYLM